MGFTSVCLNRGLDFCTNLGEDYCVDSILTQIMPCIQVLLVLLVL